MPQMVFDDRLEELGDAVVGVFSASSYSAASERPANKAYLEANQKTDGAIPNLFSIEGADGFAAIYGLIRRSGGGFGADDAMSFFKGWAYDDSPRGPVHIDPETRFLVQNI